MYYSQFGEDKILAEIFSEESKGLCIEVGANDGVNDSTTMYFENVGWSCILIEPNPVLCNMIRASRNSTLVEAAASDRSGEVILYVAEGAERAHGVSTINSGVEALDKIESYGFTYNEVLVQTKTLNEILECLKIDHEINFMSIDVEGHELEALKGFSVERWHPTIILIEDSSNYEDKVVSDYLRMFDYHRFKRTGVNDWYAHKTNKKLVNVYSRYKYSLAALKVRIKNRVKNILKKVPGIMKVRRFYQVFFTKSK